MRVAYYDLRQLAEAINVIATATGVPMSYTTAVPIGWQPYPADTILAEGPLGATDVQEALDLIAAAGPFFTTEQFASYTLGAGGGSYTTLKSFPLVSGTARKLFALVTFTGGTVATPTSVWSLYVASAVRSGAGVVTTHSLASLTSNNFSAFNASWSASGGNALLGFRAAGGPTVRATLFYQWLDQDPP